MEERRISMERVVRFSEMLQRDERAKGTVEKYCRDVRDFASWLGEEPVRPEAVAGWKEHLLSLGLAPSTVNAKLSALNSLFCFLGWEDCKGKLLKLQRRTFRDRKRELTRSEYERLLNRAWSIGNERLALLLETICATGIRVSEVRYITVEALRAGKVDVALKGKIRTLLLPGKLCRKLLKYAQKQNVFSGEIYLTRNRRSLSRKQIWREMKDLCKGAGVEPSKVFPHNLRHLFATVFYRVCRDIVKLADILGHSSINTTRIYLMTTGAEHLRQLNRLGLVT